MVLTAFGIGLFVGGAGVVLLVLWDVWSERSGRRGGPAGASSPAASGSSGFKTVLRRMLRTVRASNRSAATHGSAAAARGAAAVMNGSGAAANGAVAAKGAAAVVNGSAAAASGTAAVVKGPVGIASGLYVGGTRSDAGATITFPRPSWRGLDLDTGRPGASGRPWPAESVLPGAQRNPSTRPAVSTRTMDPQGGSHPDSLS